MGVESSPTKTSQFPSVTRKRNQRVETDNNVSYCSIREKHIKISGEKVGYFPLSHSKVMKYIKTNSEIKNDFKDDGLTWQLTFDEIT